MKFAKNCIEYIKAKVFKFDGKTYNPKHDAFRLKTQLGRVLDVMECGEWKTLGEIAKVTCDPQASISARLRDLRKPKFGSYVIDRRNRGPKEDGLFEYKLSKKIEPTENYAE